jgi:hypothetical protein
MVRVGSGFRREACVSLPAGCNGDAATKSSAIGKFRAKCGGVDDFSPGEQFYV